MKRIVFFVILLLSMGTVTAQVLTLQECVAIAIEHNNSLKLKSFMANSAEYDVLSSYSGYLPSMDLSVSKGETTVGPSIRQAEPDEVSGFDPTTGQPIYGGIVNIPKSLTKSNSISFNVNQNIFSAERLANIFEAQSKNKAARYDLQNEKNNTIQSVTEAYYSLIKELKLQEVDKIAVERSIDQLNRTEKMYELGSKAKLDVYQAKVNLGNDKIALLTQNNTVNEAKRKLNIVMGREPNAPLDIVLIDVNHSLPSDLEELISQALENHPLLKKNDEDIKASKYAINRSKAKFLPTLSAFFQYSRRNSDFEKVYSEFNFNYSWTAAVQLNMNLFNGFNDYSNVQKAKINEMQARENQINFIRELKSSISSSFENYKSYVEIIDINRENLAAAREELRLAQERYQIGSGTSLDVREAQVKLTRAEETLISAQYNAMITLSKLDAELGVIEQKIMAQQ